MAGVREPGAHGTLDWEYDRAADVLYLSVVPPRPAVGVDVGEGLVVRYDDTTGEFVGLTVLDLLGRVGDRLGAD